MLVGTTILNARKMAPDTPQALPAPAGTVTATATTGGSLSLGTYIIRVTALNAWGETNTSSAVTVVVDGSNNAVAVGFNAVAGASSYRVYYGSVDGALFSYEATTNTSYTILGGATAVSGAPPSRSTAYLPESDGTAGLVSIYDWYGWLNEGLGLAARVTGGIPDITGVTCSSASPIYQITGQWLKFTHAWYDGWPLGLGGKQDTFQRTRVQGITGIVTPFKQNDKQYIEAWPIPTRDGMATTLSGAMSATATTVPMTSVVGLLDHGLAQIESEILYYGQVSGNSLVGLVRGIGGTAAAAHSGGVAVNELNLRLDGYRMPETYAVGMASATLTVPPAWETILPMFLLSKFREVEQDPQNASRLRQEFTQEMKLWANSVKPLTSPRQMGSRSGVVETVGGGGGGGWIRL